MEVDIIEKGRSYFWKVFRESKDVELRSSKEQDAAVLVSFISMGHSHNIEELLEDFMDGPRSDIDWRKIIRGLFEAGYIEKVE